MVAGARTFTLEEAFLEPQGLNPPPTRHALLVLDNCEHVRATAASFARGLLAACPEVVVLATSRERLGVIGERVVEVPPLDVAASDGAVNSARASRNWVGDMTGPPLFVGRAAGAPGPPLFSLTPHRRGRSYTLMAGKNQASVVRKSQIPNSKQIPTTKFQTKLRSQFALQRIFGDWILEVV